MRPYVRVVESKMWHYHYGYQQRNPPCGCSGLYIAHTIGEPGKGITHWFEPVCECLNCGAVWMHADWMGDD